MGGTFRGPYKDEEERHKEGSQVEVWRHSGVQFMSHANNYRMRSEGRNLAGPLNYAERCARCWK